ncbi:hypothetical protein B0H12DRAFT_298331 [Mycena haematopus]|nr:hypothetical protein B0H12DRAFT_298331 [Mycena haematopus]
MGRRRSRPNHRGGQLNRDLREQVEQEAQRKAHSPFKQKIKPSVTDTSWKPRDPRRGRSDAALKEHKRKYTTPGGAYDNGQRYWLNQTEMVTKGDSYPRDFVGFAKDAAKVIRIVGEKFPGNQANLPIFSTDDSKVILVSGPPPTSEEEALCGVGGIGKWLERRLSPRVCSAFETVGPPPFDVGRFPNVISSRAQFRLLEAWDRVQALKPVYGLRESQRSSSPALHLGVWERYTKEPIVTGDSRQADAPCDRRQELVEALHDLCGVIKQFVIPRLRAILEWYYPGQEWIWEAMHRRILKHLGSELAEHPNFDFGGIITTVACKEGGSEKIHLDWFDNLNIFAWVTAIGDFEGANFCTPQLGGQMVSKPGSLLGARTRLLAHCCTPISGRRIVFTFFVDSCLFEKTMHELN